MERHIRDKIAEREGGRVEVDTGFGIADIVTDDEVIEVKQVTSPSHVAHAMGQAQMYADTLGGGRTPRVHLFAISRVLDKILPNAIASCRARGVEVTSEEIADDAVAVIVPRGKYYLLTRLSDGMVHATRLANSLTPSLKWSELRRSVWFQKAVSAATGATGEQLTCGGGDYPVWIHYTLVVAAIQIREITFLGGDAVRFHIEAVLGAPHSAQSVKSARQKVFNCVVVQWHDDAYRLE